MQANVSDIPYALETSTATPLVDNSRVLHMGSTGQATNASTVPLRETQRPWYIYIYICYIIILVYNTRLEYHCMHEHVRSTACSICVRSSGMGETARGAGTGCVRPAGKKRRHNGTSWRHVIIFGGSFSHLCRRRRSAGTAMHAWPIQPATGRSFLTNKSKPACCRSFCMDDGPDRAVRAL